MKEDPIKKRLDSIKFKEDIFYKIIGKKQVYALASATGSKEESNIEYIKDYFYDRYTFAARVEFEGWCKIDVARLWDEFAIEFLLDVAVKEITVTRSSICVTKDTYYQLLIRIWTSMFNHKYFGFVEFLVKNSHGCLSAFWRNIFKKLYSPVMVLSRKCLIISFSTKDYKFFKKIAHSITQDENSIILGDIKHNSRLSRKGKSDNKEAY